MKDFPLLLTTNNFAAMISYKRVSFFTLLLVSLWGFEARAQDTVAIAEPVSDTISLRPPDSLTRANRLDRFKIDSGFSVYGYAVAGYIVRHPNFHAAEKAIEMLVLERTPPDTDWIFYFFTGLLFYLALLKLIFPKYFFDLFRVFFNTALRQKQIREQLTQEPLPSLLLNIFFVISGGAFGYFVLVHQGLNRHFDNKWLLLGICILSLIIIYVTKFLFLQFMGWILGKREEAEAYTFIVYMVNKIAGMALLPAGMLMALSEAGWARTILFFVWAGLAALFLYRMIRAYQMLYKSLKINFLHLVVFVVSFEIIPILVLYKVLLNLFA
jgi:hypothetical protein